MAPRRGRPLPVPEHRVQHGTVAGHAWHSNQRKKDPAHETCPRCKKFWRERQAAYRRKRRRQQKIIDQIMLGALRSPSKKDRMDAERLVNKYATAVHRKELFDE